MPISDKLDVEIQSLRSELASASGALHDQLYAAMQVLEWAKSPEVAVAPTWAVLAGKCFSVTDTLAG